MPAGAVGVFVLLGSAAPGDAGQHPAASQAAAADRFTVAERLAAIRQAVSDVAGDAVKSRPGEQQLAWGNWWRNGGWRNGGWGNWRNGWHNRRSRAAARIRRWRPAGTDGRTHRIE